MKLEVAVRTLCDFTARAGDLDSRFTPAPTALEGMAGHAVIAHRRAAHVEHEVTLSANHAGLTVRGRADGYDPRARRVEEVKTYRGDLAALRANQRALHRAQARVYGHMLCASRDLAEITVAVVYFNLDTEEETAESETLDAATLASLFNDLCERYAGWATQERAHREARDGALEDLAFPYGQMRAGQRELAVAVYRAARDGHPLMAQAPTGVGKTLGTLFPLLKACATQGLDKVYFLSAKGPGHGLALDAVARLHASREGGLPLRVVALVARDKACAEPDRACHGDACPRARGFYDRLPAARAQALARPDATLTREAVRAVADAHGVCPYYLNQELARWSDVVVGDYNYWFDANAMLHALTLAHQWRVAVAVDEAHNLLARARRMYSVTLSMAELRAARLAAPGHLRKPLDALLRSWRAVQKKQDSPYAAYDMVPAKLREAAQRASTALAEHFAGGPAAPDDPALSLYFTLLQFGRLADSFGTHALFDLTVTEGAGLRAKPESEICIRNVVPAPYLAARHAAARSTVLFSGTFSPQSFHQDTLGLPATTGWVDVCAPFDQAQLQVNVVGHVSTRWRDRAGSVAPIVDLVARQYAAQPGNYLVFLSSFAYLEQVAAQLAAAHPGIPTWTQAARMNDDARAAFLGRFTETGQGVGFAVLGGAFSEGVDLPGRRLIGAFIATLGLPQVNPVNKQMLAAMRARFGDALAYDYTYLYPGLQKVVQAAGRVIRTETDTGTVYLIDDRYRQRKVRALLPDWWRVAETRRPRAA
ncbi:DinG family ATP-dependent helicase CPE1197 [plant metagenome]|uniref:DinG family ATP-dependent helicase CPE1197 n=1 Tax=plant metagenome TaxID=1297885 RepID=A0A484PE40_9ZZZZ